MGIFGKTLNVFYDKRTKKVYCWDTNLKSKDTVIAPNLINGAVAEGKTPVSHVRYVNDFQDGKCHLKGQHTGKCLITVPHKDKTIVAAIKENYGEATIEYDFTLTRLSKPCVASIPFGKNRPLYTRNQSIDQEKYNENILWLEGKTSILPPITFTRNPESKDFKDYSEWIVKDEHDMVNLKFKVYNMNPMIMHALVVNIDYYVAYGELEGYIRDEGGKKYVLDGMLGMGEDKTLLL